MLIRKRIVISNILMIIIPVILIILTAGLLYLSYINIYDLPKNMFDEGRDKSMWAQHSIKKSLNHFQYSQDNFNKNEQSEFQEDLLDGGFYTVITRNGEIIASNLTDEIEKQVSIMDIGNALPEPVVIQSGSRLLIRDSVRKDNDTFTITAYNPAFKMNRVDWIKQLTIVETYAAIVFILSLIIVAVTNAIVSIKLSKKITEPLDLLNYGAEQIKNGNLDFKISYHGKDEFGQAITNFDEMRARLHQSIQTQLKYEEDRKEIVAGISHDLRTPLTAIKGYVKGLMDGVANTPEKQQQYNSIIFNKACEMDSLVDNLFLFSKLDTGHLPFYFETIGCRDYLDHLINHLKIDYEVKGLRISYHNNCPKGIAMKVDFDQMSRVFVNILDNSAKYKSKDVCNVNIEVILKETEIIIEICDDGNGVPEEIIPDLFKSFYRGDVSRTNSNGSSGLGLSIADRIIKAHTGVISAHNRNGLAISIKLPIIEEENCEKHTDY